MGLLHDLFKGKSDDEVFEVSDEEEPKGSVMIRIERLVDFVDIDRVGRLVADGNIVVLKTADLQRQDLGEFQNCVQKLKRISSQNGWDIAGTKEGYLVVTPKFASIVR